MKDTRLTIADIPTIHTMLRTAQEDVIVKDVANIVIRLIGTGDTITKKALKQLANNNPITGISIQREILKNYIEIVLDGPKLLKEVETTRYIRHIMFALLESWERKDLIKLNNYLYLTISHGSHLGKLGWTYKELINCMIQLIPESHKGARKKFYGETLRNSITGVDVPDEYSIYWMVGGDDN